MKRIIVIFLSFALLLACVPTPEEEFVHNQSEDYMEHVQVIENTPTDSPTISEAAQPEEIPMKELLVSIAAGLVEAPDQVVVTVDEPNEEGVIVYHLHVAEDDMGRVIGKQGRIAKAIRTVMRAAANRTGDKVMVEID